MRSTSFICLFIHFTRHSIPITPVLTLINLITCKQFFYLANSCEFEFAIVEPHNVKLYWLSMYLCVCLKKVYVYIFCCIISLKDLRDCILTRFYNMCFFLFIKLFKTAHSNLMLEIKLNKEKF